MALPSGYDQSPLSPKVLIYNLDNVLQYTYETSAVASSPTQDFNLRGLSIHMGLNDDYGNAVLLIDDPSNTLIDTDIFKSPKIKRQWNIQIYLGKSSSTLNRWFYGKVYEVEVARPTSNYTQLVVKCVGWGIRLKERMTMIKRFQDKTSDGLQLDSTDSDAKVSELAKDIIQDTDHLVYTPLGLESEITVNNVDDIDIKIADFQHNPTTFASALSDLAGDSNAIYHVDADRNLTFRNSTANDSGFLFSSDVDSIDTQNWNVNKLGIIQKQDYSYSDSTGDSGYSFLQGIGTHIINKDLDYTSGNAEYTASNWIAIPITPTQNNIAKVAISMKKTGTPTLVGEFSICSKDGSGNPNKNSIKKQARLAKESLQTLGSVFGYREIAFDNIATNANELVYLIIKKNSSIVLEYQSGTGTYYDSSDGDTWTQRTGQFKFRTYSANNIILTLENTVAKRRFGIREKSVTFPTAQDDTAREALIGMSEILSKEKRMYSDIVISPTTSVIPVGKWARFQDKHTGLDTKVEIASVDLSMVASDDSVMGANQLTLGLVEYR